jgi:hypothetical protein
MKLTVLFFSFSFFVFSASAQSGQMEVGFSTGLSISSLHGENFKHYYDWQYTTIGVAHVKYTYSDVLSLVSDIALETKGCKGTDMKLIGVERTSLGSNHQFSYSYNYLTMPVMARYSAPELPFFVNAGPYIGYLLKYTEWYDIIEMDRTQDMKKVDLGMSIGAGMVFTLSELCNLSVELRNNLGLYNVRTKNDTYQTAAARPVEELDPVTTNSINILVGLNYKL